MINAKVSLCDRFQYFSVLKESVMSMSIIEEVVPKSESEYTSETEDFQVGNKSRKDLSELCANF